MSIIRKIMYSPLIRCVLNLFFSLFYDKAIFKGYYFTTKRLGYYWCLRSLLNRVCGANHSVSWPVNPQTLVSNSKNIEFHVDDLHIFQTPGCYWQNIDAKIVIGRGCYIAPNVGLITTNHDIYDISKHVAGKDIVLGNSCWIGMNSVILPGVHLGDNTIVAAGAVVSRSFEEGHCVIGGVPAKVIKFLGNDKKDKE